MDLEELLPRKTWRWLRIRIEGLLATKDSRVHLAFAPPDDEHHRR